MTLDECEKIFEIALSSKSESEFCHATQALFDAYEILSLEIGRGSIFWRARVIEDSPYSNIEELNYPLPELAKQGRLNDVNDPCFYVSARKETAIAEVNALDSQLVQVAGFRVLTEFPVRLAVIGEYANVEKNGYMHFSGQDPDFTIAKHLNEMSLNEARRKIYIDKFFSHILSDKCAYKNEYMFSRSLGKLIYSRNQSSGIVFPSVKDRGGFNIAIKAEESDKSFHNVCCIILEVVKNRRFNLIETRVIKSAEQIDKDGNFIWRDDNNPEIIGIYGMNREEYEAAILAGNDRNGMLNMLRGRST